MKTVIIKIFQDRLWFNEDISIGLDQTNLPFKYFKFSQRPIFWKLEMKSYDREEEILSVNVVDFKAPYNKSWIDQKPKAIVSKLDFGSLDWGAFCKCLNYYQSDAEDMMPYNSDADINSKVRLHELKVDVPLSNIEIGVGKVTFQQEIKWSKNEVLIEVLQSNMIPGFESIKPYFSKILKKNTLSVSISLKVLDTQVEVIKAESEDLRLLDDDAIYVIKSYKINDWKQTVKEKYKTQILLDEKSFKEYEFGNLDGFEREILFHVLEDSSVRNISQLNYLSNILLDSQKLLLTAEPQLGFVFIVSGKELIHCIWELVNSSETYVWSFNSKNFGEHQFTLLNQEFSIIAQSGRSNYSSKLRNSPEVIFNIVEHKKSDDVIIDHFGKWKIELEKLFA